MIRAGLQKRHIQQQRVREDQEDITQKELRRVPAACLASGGGGDAPAPMC